MHPCKSLLETDLSEYAIHDVSAVLKELLRHLPEPVFPYKTYHDVIEILQYRQSPLFRLKELNHLMKQLSEVRRYVLGKILYHLAVISSKSNHNRMNSKSLGRFSKVSNLSNLDRLFLDMRGHHIRLKHIFHVEPHESVTFVSS